MAASGFKPEESITLWQNMAKGGGAPAEFMSTHPSSDTRIKQLWGRLEKANALRRVAIAEGKVPNCRI